MECTEIDGFMHKSDFIKAVLRRYPVNANGIQ